MLLPLPGESVESSALELGATSKTVGSSMAQLLTAANQGKGGEGGMERREEGGMERGGEGERGRVERGGIKRRGKGEGGGEGRDAYIHGIVRVKKIMLVSSCEVYK